MIEAHRWESESKSLWVAAAALLCFLAGAFVTFRMFSRTQSRARIEALAGQSAPPELRTDLRDVRLLAIEQHPSAATQQSAVSHAVAAVHGRRAMVATKKRSRLH